MSLFWSRMYDRAIQWPSCSTRSAAVMLARRCRPVLRAKIVRFVRTQLLYGWRRRRSPSANRRAAQISMTRPPCAMSSCNWAYLTPTLCRLGNSTVSPFLLFDLTNRILCGRLDLSSLTTRCSNVVLRPGPMIQHLLFVLGCSTASASQTNENIGRAFTVLIGCSANAFTVGQPSKLPKSLDTATVR
jgi:hypothetical protein